MALRVGVVGAAGRMGTSICAAVEADEELELVARIGHGDDIAVLEHQAAEVVVDVSVAQAARANVAWCLARAMHVVVGATGFTDDDLARFQTVAADSSANCLLVPNFSIGAVLLMHFAALAAPYFDGVEVIELHHDKKKDAPSGTARHTAEHIAAARKQSGAGPWAPDPTIDERPTGVRGGLINGVPVHSVRLRGLLAHEEVLFGTTGQTLTLRHDSYDRSAFMSGVLLAVKAVPTLPSPGFSVGIQGLLGL